jgi:alpha-glucosidase
MTDIKKLRWWQRGVVYQIYPRSFKDSNHDGVGDLQGIISHLDYLNDGTTESLGIDAIWISPFFPSPMADFGYDVADYTDVDPLFGDLETFDRLIEAAHKRGIKVIIDFVPNHSSDQHEWFIESRSSRDNPKRDWYIWRDPKPDGSPPNNWGSWFGGPAWTFDETTGQYYLHSFVKEQPDLNWRNPEVYEAMLDVLRFWLERGVDGFRMDVVFLLVKHPELPDKPLRADVDFGKVSPNDLYGMQIHMYDRDQEGIHDVLSDFRRLTDSYGDTCIIAEIWVDDLSRWVRYYGEEGSGVQLPFNFRLMEIPEWNAALIRQSVDEFEEALPAHGWPNYVLGSHDKTRIATRIGQAQARVAAMLMLTLRGTSTLYNGDEIGMEEGDIPPDKIQDPQGLNLGPERSRDGCRAPLQWDDSAYAGFSTVEPWLPVNDDYSERNVAAQRHQAGSILNLYRRLMWYRKDTPALYGGDYRSFASPDGTYVYLREAGGERRLIALNFTHEEKSVTLPYSGEIAVSTHMDRQEAVSGTLVLRPDEGVIIAVM